MTFLEQIQANNDPNSPARIAARAALAKMEKATPKNTERVEIIGHNGLGDVQAIVDEDGENWIQFEVDFI